MLSQTYSRRSFLKRATFYFGVAPVVFSGCESKKSSTKKENEDGSIDPCDDFTGLSETDIKIRAGLGYVKKSPVTNMQCNNCNLWLPPGQDKKCGGCLLFKGPVDPSGYCTNWAAKV